MNKYENVQDTVCERTTAPKSVTEPQLEQILSELNHQLDKLCGHSIDIYYIAQALDPLEEDNKTESCCDQLCNRGLVQKYNDLVNALDLVNSRLYSNIHRIKLITGI